MKPAPLLLAGSLLANAALLGVFVTRPELGPPAWRDYFSSGVKPADAAAARDAERVAALQQRRKAIEAASAQSRLWAALNSDDLPTLVAQLRAAGFPATVVRFVIDARLQTRFAARLQPFVQAAQDTPFWKTSPAENFTNRKFFEETNQLYRERSRLLRDLLGDDFFANAGADPTIAQRRQFGDLPKSKIDQLQRISDDYADLTSQVRAAMNGITLPEDREKFALLDREKHADLAAMLTPAELDDYEMRTSPVTSRLRSALSLLDASEEEFRTIYHIEQPFADRIYPQTAGVISSDQMQQRRDAEAQMNDQLKAALGADRYAEFSRATSYDYQSLVRLTQRENLPATVAATVFDLRDSTSQAAVRIGVDQGMSNAEKHVAMQTLAQDTRAKMIAALGPNAGPNYAKSVNWLQAIEGGTIVTFQGTITNYRPLPPAGR